MDANTEYFKRLYTEFSTKINSINKYIKKIESNTGDINQSVFEWVGKLHDKLEAIDKFQQTRPRSFSTGDFAIEQKEKDNGNENLSETDLKSLENDINDVAEVINHFFVKTEKDTKFLVQSFQNLQEIVNNIHEKYESKFKGV